MDNPSESTPLDINGAAAAFAEILEPKEQEAPAEEHQAEPDAKPQAEPQEPEAQPEAEAQANDDDQTVTVKIDGKDVEVKLSELKNGYQRQADYTRKTMEVAEQRKAAEAEATRAREERATYAQKLQEQAIVLQSALQEQNQIDWQQLLEADPVEYLKQQHLFQQRQAAFQRTQQEQAAIWQQQQAEQAEQIQKIVAEQQENLLAKLPEWKDEAKAKAEKTAIREYLLDSGFNDQELSSISDHRAVLLARKAMLYDQVMSKAQAAAKKVSNLPQKVEKPGVSEVRGTDKRSEAFRRLDKSGRVEDAAAVFASIL